MWYLVFLVGCRNNLEQELPKIYDDYGRDVLPGEGEYYYTFTGKSNHFSFSNGIADYRNDEAILEIKGLKLNNNEDFTAYIIVYFNDEIFSSRMFNNEIINQTNQITSVYGKKLKRSSDGNIYGEIDAFLKTRPDDFEKSIKIIANYCDSENNCQDEEFSLEITKHE